MALFLTSHRLPPPASPLSPSLSLSRLVLPGVELEKEQAKKWSDKKYKLVPELLSGLGHMKSTG